MFAFADLRRRIVAAPMAGGPSTPELVAAAAAAGGLGFLAAGYKPVGVMAEQVEQARGLGADLFGVNLFVPDAAPADLDAARAYARLLRPLADEYGVDLPTPRQDDDGWEAKVEALLDLRVPVVSFAFGCPPADVVARFHAVGTTTVATVTSADEARQAEASGVAALTVQGPDAGGHRATFDARAEPPAEPLDELVEAVRAVSGLPLAVAGGLATAADVAGWLARAEAVQLGTAFLDADEAGTSAPYRAALRDPRFDRTELTRAFSGRYARGLRNAFLEEFTASAPAAYPAVNQLTAPIRAAAATAGDAERLSLWAGVGWRSAPSGPVASLYEELLP